MTDKYFLYEALTLELFLPEASHPSLTKEKLEGLMKFELMSLPTAYVELEPLKSRQPSWKLREIICELNTGAIPFWFATGRLPPKTYLLQFLNALKPAHAAIGLRSKPTRKKRVFRVNTKCKCCVRGVCKEIRQQALFKLRPLPFQQKIAHPVGVTANMNLTERMRIVLKSRYQIIALKRMALRDLERTEADDVNVQVRLQLAVFRLDQLMDILQKLQD